MDVSRLKCPKADTSGIIQQKLTGVNHPLVGGISTSDPYKMTRQCRSSPNPHVFRPV